MGQPETNPRKLLKLSNISVKYVTVRNMMIINKNNVKLKKKGEAYRIKIKIFKHWTYVCGGQA